MASFDVSMTPASVGASGRVKVALVATEVGQHRRKRGDHHGFFIAAPIGARDAIQRD